MLAKEQGRTLAGKDNGHTAHVRTEAPAQVGSDEGEKGGTFHGDMVEGEERRNRAGIRESTLDFHSVTTGTMAPLSTYQRKPSTEVSVGQVRRR